MSLFKSFFLATALLLLTAVFAHNVIEFDQDLGRHLLLGKIIWQTQSVPKTNLLAENYANFPFINSHWLSEVGFYWGEHIGGISALWWLKIVVATLAFGISLTTAIRYSKSWEAAAIGFALFCPILLERTEIRPEIFSFLFTAIFVFLILEKRGLWMLPILELIWVNSHIYFILGPILAGIFFLQERSRRALGILTLTFLATFINPNGLGGALYPFTVFNNYGYAIQENQNIWFLGQVTSNLNIGYFYVALAALIGSFVVTEWKKIKAIHIFLAILAVLPILAIRSFPYFFILELPVISYNLGNLNPRINFKKGSWASWVLALAVGINLVRSGRLADNSYYLSQDSPKRFGFSVRESGAGAASFVINNNLKGPVFNNFDIGSYLDYRFYPEIKVFVDGRPEAYPREFFSKVYIPMQQSRENFEAMNKQTKFQTIIFAHTDATPWAEQFMTQIASNPNWKLVYVDSYAVVFNKESGGNEKVEERLDVAAQESDYLGTIYLARLASLWQKSEESQKLVQRATVLRNLRGENSKMWF